MTTKSQTTRFLHRILGTAIIGLAAGTAIIASPADARAEGPSKIAVVDVRRAVAETEEGLRVQANLKKLFDSRQTELDAKQQALAREKEDLDREAQSGKSNKETLQRKFEALQKRALELQALSVDYQREMQRKESEMTTPILQKILGVIRRIASQDGYEMILEKSAVPYFRGDLEITDRAIQMYNSGQSTEAPPAPGKDPSKKPPAAPTAPPASKPATPPAKPAPAPTDAKKK